MKTEDILAHKPKVLTDAQREFYFDRGYLLLERLVSKEWVDRLNEVTEEMLEKSCSVTQSDKIFDLEPGHSVDNPRLRRITSPVDHHPLYWEFASQSIIVDVVEDLVGPDIKFHHSKLNFKWKKGGEEVKWHQDISFWPHTNYTPLTVGTYLSDVGTEQAPMGVIPGAHKGPLYSQYDEERKWVGCLNDKDLREVPLETADYLMGPAGSVTIHNCRMIHGSKTNRSNESRPLLLNAYSSADAFTYSVNPLQTRYSGYHGAIVRGQQAEWAHHDPRPCELPPDWSKGYTSIFALQQEENM